MIACLKASDIDVQGNGYSAAKAPKYEAKKDPVGLDFKPFGWGLRCFKLKVFLEFCRFSHDHNTTKTRIVRTENKTLAV